MADPSQIYHTSGTPPLLYYKGNEIIGGTVTSVDKKDDTFLCGTLYSISSSARMAVTGEMPVTLSSKKKYDAENDPYEAWLKWKKEQEKEMLKEEK